MAVPVGRSRFSSRLELARLILTTHNNAVLGYGDREATSSSFFEGNGRDKEARHHTGTGPGQYKYCIILYPEGVSQYRYRAYVLKYT